MSPSPQLAPPGSSVYNSDTLSVGDGTWDAGRNNFLLPPLVGVNFATMRYNGMGNRFFTLTGYHGVIKAHGVLAAITFLAIIPTAIFVMRFGGRNPRAARRVHIWLQVLTLLLSTVVIILGVFAVGPERSLSNPHHGIGVAIYTLIWVQVIGGCLVHRQNKKHRQTYTPLRAMLHHWLGRMIALLGIAQVPLGLTLYGSPLSLFVLYALYMFALVVLYFILEWLHERRRAEYGSEGSSYITEDVTTRPDRQHGGLGKLAAAGAAGAGLAALFRRRSSGRQHQSNVTGTDSATSYVSSYDEKYSAAPQRTGWGTRLLQIGAIGGGIAAAKKIFGRKQQQHSGSDLDSDVGPYRQPLGGNQSVVTDSMSRIEEGRPPRPVTPTGASPGHIRPTHPLAQPPMTPGSGRRSSDDSYSDYTYMSASPSRRGRHQTFRQAAAAGGTMFAVRQLFKNRRQKKEERRADDLRKQRMEEERIQRMNSVHRYTGDGTTPPRRVRHSRMNSQTASDVSSTIDGSVQHPGTNSALPLAGAGIAAASALADRDHIRPVGSDPVVSHPGPASSMPSNVAPPPPPHIIDPQSSGSELYTTGSGRQRHQHHTANNMADGAAGLAAGGVAAAAARRRYSSQNTNSMESPPVSLKVKMHQDGRHVTLRRLTEEEAAAQREARRQDGRVSSSRRRRNSSMSSGSGVDEYGPGTSADRRWRRTEALEAQQAAENEAAAGRRPAGHITPATTVSPMPGASTSGPMFPTPPPPGTQQAVDPVTGQTYQMPLPPPIPGSMSNLGPAGSITSPGTETSGATEYANNRRRRRAERAQARQAREGRTGGGNTVDFT